MHAGYAFFLNIKGSLFIIWDCVTLGLRQTLNPKPSGITYTASSCLVKTYNKPQEGMREDRKALRVASIAVNPKPELGLGFYRSKLKICSKTFGVSAATFESPGAINADKGGASPRCKQRKP